MIVKVKNFPNRLVAEQAQQCLEAEWIPSIIQPPIDIVIFGPAAPVAQRVDTLVPQKHA